MSKTTPQRNDDSYKAAQAKLDEARAKYKEDPGVGTLLMVYWAQEAVRVAANKSGAASVSGKQVDAKTVQQTLAKFKDPMNEPIPGEGLGVAQALLAQLRDQQNGQHGPQTIQQSQELANAQRQLESYIETARARMQQDDNDFAERYTQFQGKPPVPGQFGLSQSFAETSMTPSVPQSSPGETPTPGMQPPKPSPKMFRRSLAADGKVKKPTPEPTVQPPPGTEVTYDKGTSPTDGIKVEDLPSFTPFDVRQDYPTEGLDVAPGTPGSAPAGAADSVLNAQKVIRQGSQTGVLQTGYWFDKYSTSAVQSGQLIFTGYQKQTTTHQDLDNPSKKINITTSTPTYQNQGALKYALGQPGYPTIAEFQKQMGLPITDRFNEDTLTLWKTVLFIASANTKYHTTVSQAMQLLISEKNQLLKMRGGAVGPNYSVDPTASASVLGSAMKQVTGRLSTPAEDAEFHKAFNSAEVGSQGKVDPQQFARDWVRGKYPTEAGTMAGQDYYGAMYDVLTAGPGSLGSQAADING